MYLGIEMTEIAKQAQGIFSKAPKMEEIPSVGIPNDHEFVVTPSLQPLGSTRIASKKDSKVEGLFSFEGDVSWPEKMEKCVESESEYQMYQSQM